MEDKKTFRLRKPTNKYFLFHPGYLESDRKDVREMAKAFAKTFGISYEQMKVKVRYCSFQTDDSDYDGNGTATTAVETWLIIRWATVYHNIEYYQSEHLIEDDSPQSLTAGAGKEQIRNEKDL